MSSRCDKNRILIVTGSGLRSSYVIGLLETALRDSKKGSTTLLTISPTERPNLTATLPLPSVTRAGKIGRDWERHKRYKP